MLVYVLHDNRAKFPTDFYTIVQYTNMAANDVMCKPTIEKCTIAGGRTKEAKERSFVFVHQHGGDDVTWKPL